MYVFAFLHACMHMGHKTIRRGGKSLHGRLKRGKGKENRMHVALREKGEGGPSRRADTESGDQKATGQRCVGRHHNKARRFVRSFFNHMKGRRKWKEQKEKGKEGWRDEGRREEIKNHSPSRGWKPGGRVTEKV